MSVRTVDRVRYGFTYTDTTRYQKEYRARHLLGWRNIPTDMSTLPCAKDPSITNAFKSVGISNAHVVIASYFSRDRDGFQFEAWLTDVVKVPKFFVHSIVRGIESTFGSHFRIVRPDASCSLSQKEIFCSLDVPYSLKDIPGLDRCDIVQLTSVLLTPSRIQKYIPCFQGPVGAQDPVLQLVAIHFSCKLPNELYKLLLHEACITKEDAILVLECLYAKFPITKIRKTKKKKKITE